MKGMRLYPTQQGKNLGCLNFMDVGNRHKTLGTETKDFVINCTAVRMIFMFALVLLAHHQKFHDGNADAVLNGFCIQFYCATAEEPLD